MKRYFVFLVISMFFILGCTSIKQPKTVYEKPDYSQKDIVENEKKRISKIAVDFPVKAYWLSILLGDQESIMENEENLCSLFASRWKDGKYNEAAKIYFSLEACASQSISRLGVSKMEITKAYYKDVPGLSVDRSLLPGSWKDCINATVTVWVDRGIKIQNGAGYADRVIGSGFFIDKRGYIITNHHVIEDLVNPKYEGYARLFVKLARDSETRIPAKVVGYDDVLDLALLKVEVDPPFVLELGSSSNLSVGDKVLAIGTPLGLDGTITSGIVSSVGRKLFTTGSVLQIDAAVNSGNSGGPLIDKDMKVQAIVFAGIPQYQGLNFAVPVEYLKQDLPYLYRGGKRFHSWVSSFGHTKKEGLAEMGLELQYSMPGGVTNRAGLMVCDRIVSINGQKVYNLESLQDIFRNFEDETIVKCEYVRGAIKKNALLYLDRRPESPGYEIYEHDLINNSFIPIFGMKMERSSTTSTRKFSIVDIIKGSIADESGFSVTDPVYVSDVIFNEDKTAISVAISTRKRKSGYFDVSLRMGASLDSPYYF